MLKLLLPRYNFNIYSRIGTRVRITDVSKFNNSNSVVYALLLGMTLPDIVRENSTQYDIPKFQTTALNNSSFDT